MSGAFAGMRLALGLLTILPVGEVRMDRRTARAAMLAAPMVGLMVGLLAWSAGAAVQALGAGPLLAATLSIGALAAVTRALHLDGLADLADGLGSAKPAAGALEVMRRSDVGPFGVVTLLLVLLLQVAALTQAWAQGDALVCLVLAGTTSRLLLAWSCRSTVPAARADGLGALVAGSVPTAATVAASVLVLGLAGLSGAITGAPLAHVVAVLSGLAAGLLLLRRAVARLGGVTGDVHGAVVEAAATASILGLVLARS